MKKDNRTTSKKPSAATAKKSPAKDYTPWLIGASLLLTFIAYLPALQAGFVSWDDDDYVGKNTTIQSFSHFNDLLTKPVQGNYHPLTMLSLALNYSISAYKPWSYHLVNVILHLLNVLLVYRLASKLSGNNNVISFATALLFGVHPMHVESVAWVAERKDVLYTFFFLLGLNSYVQYSDSGTRRYLLLTFLWFVLSILSKPAAIIFPVVLFVIDFYKGKKFNGKMLAEKIPFFLIAAVFAYLTLSGQKNVGAMDKTEVFGAGDRIFFAFYGYMMYFLKMIFPVNLVAFYPTPPINESLPAEFLASPVFFILTVVLCLATRKKYPVITFGFAFYFVNLLLVLQLVVVGSAVMAERYTYVPYTGLFFLFGWWLDQKLRLKTSTSFMVLGAAGLLFTAVSYSQAKVWTSGATLWDNAIEKHPSAKAYLIRANELKEKGNSEKALDYYNKAILISWADPEAFGNRGNIYFERGQDSLALIDYNKALSMNREYAPALTNRGALLSRASKFEEGMKDLNRAIEIDPDYAPAYKNRAVTFMNTGKFAEAIRDFTTYVKAKPEEAEIYNAIGVCYQNLGKYEESFKPFADAIAVKPDASYYLNRSYSSNALGRLDDARKDAIRARELGAALNPEYVKRIGL